MLHGIYGRGRNWQAVAQGVVAARPEYACWLVDLPHHGDSGPGAHGDTVRGLAQDLSDWLVAAGLTPDAVLGHSYGGKVALAYAMGAPPRPLQVWVIDSTPEAKSPSGSAWHMLAAVRGLPDRFARREDFVEALAGEGFALGVAQWMSTNLVRTGDGFTWRLDFSAMERLLLDFFTTDLWSVVDAPPDHVELHFLKASQSNAMSSGAVKRVAAAAHSWVHLHHREGGHWIHAEAPAVVTALLVKCLPPAIR
jgi:pimeloyl-ACP methyl ester carboxylesterase